MSGIVVKAAVLGAVCTVAAIVIKRGSGEMALLLSLAVCCAVLAPVLGIGDPRTDGRISFMGGIRGDAELAAKVDSGENAVAFAMEPVTVDEMMAIADAGAIMPPKSTWFEPKLRSGLFVHTV